MAGVSVVLGLSLGAMPAAGLVGRLPLAPDGTPSAVLELSHLEEALGRGELPFEVVAVGGLGALVLGLMTSLGVGAVRQRRRSTRPSVPSAVESADDLLESRSTLPWPAQDTDAFGHPAHDVSPQMFDEAERSPFGRTDWSAPLDAAQAETWAEHEARLELAGEVDDPPLDAPPDLGPDDRIAVIGSAMRSVPPWPTEPANVEPSAADAGSPDTIPDPRPTWAATQRSVPSSAIASIEPALGLRAEPGPIHSALGTPDAPLVVELHDERERPSPRRAGPNLPLVAAAGTVAIGVAFSAGAAVGAALGVGVGAAIGLAFAGGAGVAIGVTVALLGAGRR